ncbi:hypothetical protein SAY87_000865 [Trapa incisa]|uniref:Uncharacterized protein n=1 Tax=Trapa incisa TaxID=236973 RepID=A0AAN7GJK2_9MYRT|nr:hypothetical protein SAY87_000865 [Trapa incisa]
MEPLKFNDVATSRKTIDSLEFRRVACTGVKRLVFVGPRSQCISGVTENGYYLVMPLVLIVNNSQSLNESMKLEGGDIST